MINRKGYIFKQGPRYSLVTTNIPKVVSHHPCPFICIGGNVYFLFNTLSCDRQIEECFTSPISCEMYGKRLMHFLFLNILFVSVTSAEEFCDSINGTAGEDYCVLFPNYDDYQKAECGRPPFTTITNETVVCVDTCRDFCWFPCMVKEFNQYNGTVDPSCECTANKTQMCATETGSVDFYTECANTTVPCDSTSPSYLHFAVYFFEFLSADIASTYNESFCSDSNRKKNFRICVENSLRPLLTDNNTCSYLNGVFDDIFDNCQNRYCDPVYRVGINRYEDDTSMETDKFWYDSMMIPQCMSP